MNIQVTPHTITLTRTTSINAGEYNITPCVFEFSDEYSNLTKEAVFSTCSTTVKTAILNNQCIIPFEVLQDPGNVLIGVFGYDTEDDELILRYSPKPVYFNVVNGSFKEGNDPDLPAPTEWELVLEQINEAIEKTNNLNITVEKTDHITTITLTKKDGTQKVVNVEDGQDGISLENIEIDNRDLYVTYGGETENLGQVAPNIQVGTTTTGSPSSQASVENVGTDLNPILNFYIPKGEAGSIKFEIVEQLPTQDIDPSTIYLLPYAVITVEQLPSTGNPNTIYIVSSTNKRYVYESNQWIEITSDNKYAEYLYINNEWEQIGGITVDIDLSDYYTKTETNTLLNGKVGFTDYASSTTGGVIKVNTNTWSALSNNHELYCLQKSYTDYQSGSTLAFISKGTLENVIAGKGLVSNTDYANYATAGVVKTNLSFETDSNGGARCNIIEYSNYPSANNRNFISKGTLENVITGKDLTTKAYVDGLVGDINTALDTINGEVI